jgi:glycosyltransferase involved in cell wall biosynthesis
MTKAGGPNPRRHFPHAADIICFSVENHRFFSAHPKFRRARLHHIPNRAVEIEDDPVRIARIRAMLDPDKPVLMRIARFNPHYRESILQAVNLTNRLNGDGVPCQLVLIGTPQIPSVYEEILALRNENIHLLAQDEFTVDASKVLGLADVVISTGRSVMEAAGKGKVLLTPIAGGSIPVLISEDNFQGFFETNFSPRNSLEGYDEEANYAAIRNVIADPGRTAAMKEQASSWFRDHFDIHRALEKYEEMYSQAMHLHTCKFHPVDSTIGLLLSCRQFVISSER